MAKAPRSKAPLWKQALPYLCLIAAVALVVSVPPPNALEDFIGSDFWTRAALVLLVFLCLCLALSILGLLDGSVTLPFGLSFSRASDQEAAFSALEKQLRGLREEDKEQFARLRELARLLKETAQRLENLENDMNSHPEKRRASEER